MIQEYTKKDLKETLDFMAKTLVSEMDNVQACTIRLLDATKNKLILYAVCGSEEEGRKNEIPAENTYAGQAIIKKEIMAIEDIKNAPLYKMSGPAKKFTSLLVVPIMFKEEPLGVAQLYSEKNHEFSEKEKKHVRLIAHLAGISIKNAISRFEEMKAIFDISGAITSSNCLDEILDTLVKKTADVLGSKRSSWYLSGDGSKFILKFGFPEEKHGIGTEINISDYPIFQKIVENKRILNIDDPQNHPLTKYMSQLAKDAGINAVLFTPLVIEEEVLGVAVFDAVGKKRYFSEEEVFFASAVANFAALAVSMTEKAKEESALAALGEAAAEICHVIRNPLTAIGGFAGRIKKYPKSDSVLRYASIISKEVERLENLLNDVLRFAGQKELTLEKLENIADVIKEVIEIEKMGEIKIKFSNKVAAPIVPVDAGQIKGVFFDLIRNAKEAIIEGGRNKGEIFIEISEKTDCIAIKIENSGSKIPKEIQKNIFNPFFTTKANGTGLGLANVASVVKKHGGSIKVKSEEKEKETEEKVIFVIKLPKKKESEK